MGKKKGSKKKGSKKGKGEVAEVDPAAEQAKAEGIRAQILEWHTSVGAERKPSTAFQAYLDRAAGGEPAWMPGGGGGGGGKNRKKGGKGRAAKQEKARNSSRPSVYSSKHVRKSAEKAENGQEKRWK